MVVLIKRLLDFFERPETIRWQSELILLTFNLHAPLRRSYDKEYGSGGVAIEQAEIETSDGRGKKAQNAPALSAPGSLRLPEAPHKLTKRASSTSGEGLEEKEEDDFLAHNKYFYSYKSFTTSWMVYIVFKYLVYRLQLDKLLQHSLALDFPLHCYLVGQSIESEFFGNTITFIFAWAFLTWNALLSLRKRPHKLTGIHFILLKQRELDKFYAKFQPKCYSQGDLVASQQLEPSIEFKVEANQLRKRERCILDTMCLRDITTRRIVYRLRLNRTSQSLARLRHFIAHIHCFGFLNLAGILMVAIPYTLVMTPLDERYLRIYPNCDPNLERLNRTGKLNGHTATLTWHHALTILTDYIESFVIVIDGSMLCILGSTSIMLLIYDLMLYWQQIHEKLSNLVAREWLTCFARGRRHPPRAFRFRRKQSRGATKALLVEILDFFRQVKLVDALLTYAISIVSIGWLMFAASFTYLFNTRTSEEVPVEMIIALAIIIPALMAASFCNMILHRQCNRSYGHICTLMALDRTGSSRGFMIILEMFKHKSVCFTLFRHYSFDSKAFLKIVGYTFSAFFLVSSLFHYSKISSICAASSHSGVLS